MKKRTKQTKKSQTNMIVLAVLCGILVSGSVMYVAHLQTTTMPSAPTMTPQPKSDPPLDETPSVSQVEKQQIDQWIQKNDLNQYGDAKNTVYAGGSPLFNEATGQTIDRYGYILKHHTDKPWQK